MKIYFVRHAKTNSNSLNQWQGRSDNNISEEGLKELEILKENTRNFNADVIISSPLRRAIDTANIFKKNNKEIIIDDRLIERDFGQLEQQIVKNGEKEILSDIYLNTDLNLGVEKLNDMYTKRIKPFLNEIKKNYGKSNKKIVIVSHSWVGRLISYYNSGEQDTSLISIAPKNAVIYEYEI
ncbi:MAG: histidine phosphatase family protein [Mycoplasma sp.]|nr:histidine phosphatase family protein [Mycoplasma sp.]